MPEPIEARILESKMRSKRVIYGIYGTMLDGECRPIATWEPFTWDKFND